MRVAGSAAVARISASSTFFPFGRSWSSGTLAVAHSKRPSHGCQSSSGTGGAADASAAKTRVMAASTARNDMRIIGRSSSVSTGGRIAAPKPKTPPAGIYSRRVSTR